MSPLLIVLLLVILLFILIVLEVPIAFALGIAAMALGLLTLGAPSLAITVMAIFNNIRTIVIIAAPLFIFMGCLLKGSGIAEDAYRAAEKWIGALRGGLAVGTVLVATIFAACTGISGVATVAMGLIAIPSMLHRRYDKGLIMGSIMAGGPLGVLIPPSLLFILYGFMAEESVGRLFAAGVIPGLILSGMFIAYILVRCYLQPEYGPAVPREERASWRERISSLGTLFWPAVLIVAVLGSIFSGFATPTESAAIGVAVTFVVAVTRRKLNWPKLRDSLKESIALTAMIMWIVAGATAFTNIFAASGSATLLKSMLTGSGVSPLFIVFLMMLVYFILGCFMDPWGILLLTVPVFVPVIKALGFNGVWFGVLVIVNLEMSFLTPPFGYDLFYMIAIAPKGTKVTEIYRAAIPFITIQAVVLILVLLVPNLVLWLPNLFFGPG